MKMLFNLFLSVFVAVLITATVADISSKQLIEKQNPEIIDLNSERGFTIKEKLFKRSVRDSSEKRDLSEAEKPKVYSSGLERTQNHNQALMYWPGRKNNSRIVFLVTRKNTNGKIVNSILWRSTNNGQNFYTLQYSGATMTSYFSCLSDDKKGLFLDSGWGTRRIWLTDDAGNTFRRIETPFQAENIEYHPERCDWLLGYDKNNKKLFCSIDGGETWTKLSSGVTDGRYYWNTKKLITKPDDNKIVYFEKGTNDTNRINKVKSCYIPDCRETSLQRHLHDLGNISLDSLLVQDSYIFVQKPDGGESLLYISYNGGSFHNAIFLSYPGQTQTNIHVISSDEEHIVVGVKHDNGLAHLFFSNLQGTVFHESLNNVRYFYTKSSGKDVFNVDIHKVSGIIGTYVANVRNDGRKTTRITWDDGKSWSSIISNVTDREGNSLASSCSGTCQLNLHISMAVTESGYYMQPMLTKKTIPGVIFAHGTFGSTLEDKPDLVNLYASNDNGRSWYLARNERHNVVIANHGAVVVATKKNYLVLITIADFSNDYGKTWKSYEFSPEVLVDGILSEPGEASPYVTLLTHRWFSTGWRMVVLDFTPSLAQTCNYPGDFENITLPAFESSSCPLGLIQTTERLKEGRGCLVASGYEHFAGKKCVGKQIKNFMERLLEKFS